jgi:hypothetical protein
MYDEERKRAELDLLRNVFGDLDIRDDGERTWVRLPSYAVPTGWSEPVVELVFSFPVEVGQPPYAFCVRPAMSLVSGGPVGNYTATATTPWGSDFAQFSWSPLEPWVPQSDVRVGANMLNFALSFATRLAELS